MSRQPTLDELVRLTVCRSRAEIMLVRWRLAGEEIPLVTLNESMDDEQSTTLLVRRRHLEKARMLLEESGTSTDAFEMIREEAIMHDTTADTVTLRLVDSSSSATPAV